VTNAENSGTDARTCGDSGHRQFTVRGLLTLTAIACLWLALIVSSVSGGARLMLYLAPFFFTLFLAHRFILSAFPLALAYVAIHSIACAITAALMVQADDGTSRWAFSLPLVILDLPVTFVFAVWQPPGMLFPIYVFTVGGFFWAIIGWYIAQLPFRKPG
jgi:hypothetical protein